MPLRPPSMHIYRGWLAFPTLWDGHYWGAEEGVGTRAGARGGAWGGRWCPSGTVGLSGRDSGKDAWMSQMTWRIHPLLSILDLKSREEMERKFQQLFNSKMKQTPKCDTAFTLSLFQTGKNMSKCFGMLCQTGHSQLTTHLDVRGLRLYRGISAF